MKKNIKDITIEQADALAQLGAQLYYRRVTEILKYDGDAWTILPSQLNKMRVDKRQIPLTFMAEVE